MIAVHRSRLAGVVRLALSALSLALLVSLPCVAQPVCAMQRGDDPRWAQASFDDARWPRVPPQGTWAGQGLRGYDGTVWYRCALTLDAGGVLAAERNDLAVLLGPPAYGGYEVYAGGRLIGRSRGWSSSLPFGFGEVFRVPSAEVKGQQVTLAFRVRRIGWASDAGASNGPLGGVLALGGHEALSTRLRDGWSTRLLGEAPLLVLAALFLFVFLHHLLLFGRRHAHTEHLWFGLVALAFSVNTFCSTYWVYELTASRGIATRLSDLTGHLGAAFAIQFLWPFFERPIGRVLRGYQLSHVLLALFVGLWPDARAIFATATLRWLWLVPLLVGAAVLVLREVGRGQVEARVVAAGGVLMIAIQAYELAREVLGLPWPRDFSVAAFGFAAVVIAMSAALSLRFRRVHEELDRLRAGLEKEVDERTRDLARVRDEALAASRAKSAFLANISHEIRTPMNGVIGMADLLASSSLTPEQRAHLKAIQVSGRALLTLLNDILDFSRLESENLSIASEPFRVADVLEECLETTRPLAGAKGLALGWHIEAGSVESMIGDGYRTRQVLLNLLTNAVKFTEEGGVEVAVSSRSLEDGRVEVRFTVSDTGPGVADGDRGRLFVPFQQLDESASRLHGGAGLGLAISRRLVERMGGVIGIASEARRGATFFFTIVGEPALEPPPASKDHAWPVPTGEKRSLRILVAEDEAINRIVTLGMLHHLGYRADAVNSGTEVLEAIERETYDIVLMDIQMPGMDGLEVTRRIRAARGEQPRIIALTAHALSGDRERCVEAGMNGYLSKPVGINDLEIALAGTEQ
jgi:signal transduction histidine kinase/CheY-like chemotaxis protein